MELLTALLVLASEEAETSKTPFYVAGGVLAAWGFLFSGWAIRTEGFPATKGQRTVAMAVTTLLVLVTIASAIATG